MGSQETTCPRCALDLRLSGAVRLTNPALGNNRYNAVPRPSRRPPEQSSDENAVTRVMPSLVPRPDTPRNASSDPDATMVRPMPQPGAGQRPGPAGRPGDSGGGIWRPIEGPGKGSPEDDATQVLPSVGRPRTDQEPRTQGSIPTRTRPQATSGRADAAPPVPPQALAAGSGDGSLPSSWFRDPEVERSRDMRRQGPAQNPVFTPPPMPESPSEPAPGPHTPEPRSRRWMVVFILVMTLTFMILGVVVWWMLGGPMTRSGSLPAVGAISPSWPGHPVGHS